MIFLATFLFLHKWYGDNFAVTPLIPKRTFPSIISSLSRIIASPAQFIIESMTDSWQCRILYVENIKINATKKSYVKQNTKAGGKDFTAYGPVKYYLSTFGI